MMTNDFDEQDRDLCLDGACVGLIGPDGHCKVCGLAAREGAPYREQPSSPPDEVPQAAGALEPAPEPADAPPADWAERRLCDDGACIGVLGLDGVCGTCGNAAPS